MWQTFPPGGCIPEVRDNILQHTLSCLFVLLFNRMLEAGHFLQQKVLFGNWKVQTACHEQPVKGPLTVTTSQRGGKQTLCVVVSISFIATHFCQNY